MVVNSPGLGAGAALANSASATDISPAPQYVVPANTLYAGQKWRFTAHGILSTAASGNPTLTLGVYYGGVAGTALLTSGALTVTASLTNAPWRCTADMEVRSTGSSGTTWSDGLVYNPTSLTALTPQFMPATQTQPVTINTTTANGLTLGATWSSAVAGTSVTCEGWVIELLN
jgi:hypothetical protein